MVCVEAGSSLKCRGWLAHGGWLVVVEAFMRQILLERNPGLVAVAHGGTTEDSVRRVSVDSGTFDSCKRLPVSGKAGKLIQAYQILEQAECWLV